MSFPNTVYGKPGWEKVITSKQQHKLGTRMAFADGRVFRYASNSTAAAIAAGRLVQAPATDTGDDENIAVSAAVAAGGTKVTSGTSQTLTLDQYKEGYLYINDNAGEGQVYQVKGNTAVSGASGGIFEIDEEDGFNIALTTSSEFGVVYNPYDKIIVQPQSLTNAAVGVSTTTITQSTSSVTYYTWVQTWGICALLDTGATWVVGDQLASAETGADGAAILLDSSAAPDNQSIGYSMYIKPATTEFGIMMLTIAP